MGMQTLKITNEVCIPKLELRNKETICFSQDESSLSSGRKYRSASLGDSVTLNGGKCQGRTLIQMNKKGWKVIQVVTGLNRSFGMVMEK